MAVPDVFQTEITVVIKELVNVALLEIARVVTSGGDGEVTMSTVNENGNALSHTVALRKGHMTLISSILGMLGQEAVRKLSRVFTECCAVLQKQCQQSVQENKNLKKTLGNMERKHREVDVKDTAHLKVPPETEHTRTTGSGLVFLPSSQTIPESSLVQTSTSKKEFLERKIGSNAVLINEDIEDETSEVAIINRDEREEVFAKQPDAQNRNAAALCKTPSCSTSPLKVNLMQF
ncbi:hypothetical protein AALO_G00196580 [Alosa alosa]|uniref:Uncharacterized protein n=1 Tax=Alosa alosa TaxID=278164 RepID=A0AAV6G1G5_9TELE|nr:hypothetical protein AALO_G00196580 [Alosa alosa]